MENLKHKQWHVYGVTVVVIAFVLLVRLLALMPLYTDPAQRSRVQTLIQATANREGWLLSGVSIDRIKGDTVRLIYRSYIRGVDPQTCHNLSLTTGNLTTCDDF